MERFERILKKSKQMEEGENTNEGSLENIEA